MEKAWIPVSERLPDECENVLVNYEIDMLGETMIGAAETDYIMGAILQNHLSSNRPENILKK